MHKRRETRHPEPTPDYLTLSQAAKVLNITRQAVWLRVRLGTLPAVRIGRGWFVRPQDLPQGGAE